jgi:hypothetical protein
VLLLAPALYAHEIAVTIKPEFNRTFYYCNDFEFVGTFPIANIGLTVKGGQAFGFLGGGQNEAVFDIKTFVSADYTLPVFQPLHFSVTVFYNGLPQYETNTFSVLPLIAFNWKWAGFSVGVTNRWTSFFGEPAIYESILALSVYVNFYMSEKFRIGLRAANYSDFAALNYGAYFLNLNSIVRILPKLSVINELELYQSGGVALASNFYGVAYRGGIVYKW